jgi:hypothetical protein
MSSEAQWQIDTAYASTGKFSKFAKKHQAEFDSLFANLNKILRLLRTGYKVGGFQIGFFRPEGEGLYRIGQTGVRNAKESRLYVYPDTTENTIMFWQLATRTANLATSTTPNKL